MDYSSSNRVYTVVFMMLNRKTIRTTYDYSDRPIMSFEEFVNYQTIRKKREERREREEKRKKKAEEERRKRDVERKRKEELRKKKLLISTTKNDLLNSTLNFIKKANESSVNIIPNGSEPFQTHNKFWNVYFKDDDFLGRCSYPSRLDWVILQPGVKINFTENRFYLNDSLYMNGKLGRFVLSHNNKTMITTDVVYEREYDYFIGEKELFMRTIKLTNDLITTPDWYFEGKENAQHIKIALMYSHIQITNLIDSWLKDLNIESKLQNEIKYKIQLVLTAAFEIWPPSKNGFIVSEFNLGKVKIKNKEKYSLSFMREFKYYSQVVGYTQKNQEFTIKKDEGIIKGPKKYPKTEKFKILFNNNAEKIVRGEPHKQISKPEALRGLKIHSSSSYYKPLKKLLTNINKDNEFGLIEISTYEFSNTNIEGKLFFDEKARKYYKTTTMYKFTSLDGLKKYVSLLEKNGTQSYWIDAENKEVYYVEIWK